MQGQDSGFTLVELMVTMAVVAILAAIAAPSFSSLIRNNRLATSVNDLVVDLMLARSEAAKRGVRVSVCASSSGTACAGTDWAVGRIVFVDNGGTAGSVDIDDGDEILRVSPALSDNNTLKATVGTNTAISFLQYRPRGMTNQTGTITFKLCDDRDGPHGRDLAISPTGRSALTQNTTCP